MSKENCEVVEVKVDMDWQLTCRVCLEIGDMVSLFDWDENNEQLASKYTYCCGVNISQTDVYPTLICLNCVDRLTFSYQFKQQCLASNATLQQCMKEFLNNDDGTQTEIKKEPNVIQFELPSDQDASFTKLLNKSNDKYLVKTVEKRGRGRPKKYGTQSDAVAQSTKQRKTKKVQEKSLADLLNEADKASADVDVNSGDNGDEVTEIDFLDDIDNDADFDAQSDNDPEFNESDSHDSKSKPTTKKVGRPRKNEKKVKKIKPELISDVDMLLQETILAQTEPIPDHILNPKPKVRNVPAKKYPQKQKEKSHICDTCGSSFRSNSSLQAHIRRHLGIKPFVCSICNYSCVVKMELRRHMFKHTGVKPYQCRVCERKFADFGSRQKHERLHMGLKPFICSLCGRAFTYSYVLANHMLTHTGEKKFSCTPCNRKFTKAHHLKYHNKVHHKDLYRKMVEEAEAKKAMQKGLLIQNDGTTTTHIIHLPCNDVIEEVDETHKAVVDMQVVDMKSDYSD